MITYKITGDNVLADGVVREHLEKHFGKFEKFLNEKDPREMTVVISKVSAHNGEAPYLAEVKYTVKGKQYFVSHEAKDIFEALDAVKDELLREITKVEGRGRTLFHRGARKFKELFRKKSE